MMVMEEAMPRDEREVRCCCRYLGWDLVVVMHRCVHAVPMRGSRLLSSCIASGSRSTACIPRVSASIASGSAIPQKLGMLWILSAQCRCSTHLHQPISPDRIPNSGIWNPPPPRTAPHCPALRTAPRPGPHPAATDGIPGGDAGQGLQR